MYAGGYCIDIGVFVVVGMDVFIDRAHPDLVVEKELDAGVLLIELGELF